MQQRAALPTQEHHRSIAAVTIRLRQRRDFGVIDLAIRRFRSDDASAVLVLNAEGSPGVARLERDDLDALARPPSALVIADLNDDIVGYMIALPAGASYDGEEYRWFGKRYEHFLYIDQIVVRRDRRRLGLAGQLYAWAKTWAVTQGVGMLTCEVNVNPPNPESLAFHHALGFHVVDTLDAADGRTVALMVCRLSSSA